MQDKEINFTKTFKTFTNFVWIEILCQQEKSLSKNQYLDRFLNLKNYPSLASIWSLRQEPS